MHDYHCLARPSWNFAIVCSGSGERTVGVSKLGSDIRAWQRVISYSTIMSQAMKYS